MEQMHLHNMEQDMVSFIGYSIQATLVKFDCFKTSLHSSTLLLCIVQKIKYFLEGLFILLEHFITMKSLFLITK